MLRVVLIGINLGGLRLQQAVMPPVLTAVFGGFVAATRSMAVLVILGAV